MGTLVVAGLSFWMSFTALADLAHRAGVATPALLPLITDGLIVVATVAVVALDRARWYGWAVLLLAAGISVLGNGLHASVTSHSVTTPVAVGIAVVPPIALLLATHLSVLLRRAATPPVNAAVREQNPSGTWVKDDSRPHDEPRPDRRTTALEMYLRGEPRKQIAQRLGVSMSSVYRWTAEPTAERVLDAEEKLR